MTTLPPGVMRMWPMAEAATGTNPLGIRTPIIAKGLGGAMATGIYPGEPTLDETAAKYDTCFMWMLGQYAAGGEPAIGIYPAALRGTWNGIVKTTPHGPEAFPAVLAAIPDYVKAMRARVDLAHAAGRRVMGYIAPPSKAALPSGLSAAARTAKLKSWLKPFIDMGWGPRDIIAGDATGPCSQAGGRTAPMYWAEYVTGAGIGFCCEAHERVHPDLYPWFNGRFSCASLHNAPTAEGVSRWEQACSERGTFGPGMPHAVREHFCLLQGGNKPEERVALIPPATVSGSPVQAVIDMNDMPREWLVPATPAGAS